MQCTKCQENIYDYIDNSLTDKQMQSMSGHFKECTDCKCFLNEELKFTQITAELLEVSTSEQQLKTSIKNNIINTLQNNQQNIRLSYSFWAKAAAFVFVSGMLFATFSILNKENTTAKISKTEQKATSDTTQLESQIYQLKTEDIAQVQAVQNIDKHKKYFKSICTIYDKTNKNYWIRRNVIVDNPSGKNGFINIAVNRSNSG